MTDVRKLLRGFPSCQTVRWKAEADNEARERDSAKQLAARAPAKRLAVALMKRGWRIGAPQFSLGVLHSVCKASAV